MEESNEPNMNPEVKIEKLDEKIVKNETSEEKVDKSISPTSKSGKSVSGEDKYTPIPPMKQAHFLAQYLNYMKNRESDRRRENSGDTPRKRKKVDKDKKKDKTGNVKTDVNSFEDKNKNYNVFVSTNQNNSETQANLENTTGGCINFNDITVSNTSCGQRTKFQTPIQLFEKRPFTVKEVTCEHVSLMPSPKPTILNRPKNVKIINPINRNIATGKIISPKFSSYLSPITVSIHPTTSATNTLNRAPNHINVQDGRVSSPNILTNQRTEMQIKNMILPQKVTTSVSSPLRNSSPTSSVTLVKVQVSSSSTVGSSTATQSSSNSPVLNISTTAASLPVGITSSTATMQRTFKLSDSSLTKKLESLLSSGVQVRNVNRAQSRLLYIISTPTSSTSESSHSTNNMKSGETSGSSESKVSAVPDPNRTLTTVNSVQSYLTQTSSDLVPKSDDIVQIDSNSCSESTKEIYNLDQQTVISETSGSQVERSSPYSEQPGSVPQPVLIKMESDIDEYLTSQTTTTLEQKSPNDMNTSLNGK